MKKLDLCGPWQVRKKDDTETLPAAVPGCIHTDLLAAGKIDDPYYRDNEHKQMWIGDTAWVYSRTFSVNQAFLENDGLLLRCEGLDTLASITLNGNQIATTDNQFRIWEFDVKKHLHAGENSIEICFDSTIPLITAEQQKRYLNLTGVGHHRVDGSNRIRKNQSNYGWDWGPICVTAGIWRPIALLGFTPARITDVLITQNHEQEDVVGVHVNVNIEEPGHAALRTKITILYKGETADQDDVEARHGVAETTLIVENPKLWWPNGMGEQSRYDIKVELFEGDTSIDNVSKRIGLRTLVLDRHDDQWGESFQFVVNDRPFFAKGANWIPADTFVTRLSKKEYEYQIKSAAAANMNMLRVWGGGIYEDDVFYDLCDEYGICVWQDFMFTCSAYAAFDEHFMENVKREVEDNVKRLRHHSSLALWCGNNELEQIADMLIGDPDEEQKLRKKLQTSIDDILSAGPARRLKQTIRDMTGNITEGKMTWDEYKQLFDELLPEVVKTHDPERAYWPSSPHSPVGDRSDYANPGCGDGHLWDVWHGRKPFEWFQTSAHRFASEFGFQSFPEPDVVNSYTEPEDRNVTSYIMEHHQRSQIGNDAIIQYMLSWFQLPTSFDMLLWLSQILQGIGMKYAVEHWRRSMPRCMGTLYWQINDCWPVASWSSIDYYGNWKALHYMARDFYAPLLISGIEDPQEGTVEVHVTSDLFQPTPGVIHWRLTDTDGNTLAENNLGCANIAPNADTKVCLLDFADHLVEYGGRRLMVWLELLIKNKVVSSNFLSFTRPKHLELRQPELRTTIRALDEQSFAVTINAKHPALWVWADLPGIKAAYSHRFFHLQPEKPVEITITPKTPLNLTEFEEKLKVYSVIETWK